MGMRIATQRIDGKKEAAMVRGGTRARVFGGDRWSGEEGLCRVCGVGVEQERSATRWKGARLSFRKAIMSLFNKFIILLPAAL
jgi:hypothetical protein